MNRPLTQVASVEQRLADFAVHTRLEDIDPTALEVVRNMLTAVVGTGIAGASEDGIAALRSVAAEAGGAAQATVFVWGNRLPAAAAAMINGAMCRALDFCDAMAPGPHAGSAVFPAAMAAAELAGGCDGRRFMTALAIGAEIASRMNLTESMYAGLDPTGIAVPFGAAAAAGHVLGLSPDQMLHALALAFNRCGGSFQSHVDGSLGVRLVQGFVAEAGVTCTLLARAGLTGPANFIGGIYGYRMLYARGERAAQDFVAGLGRDWWARRLVFKKFPSCGATQGLTQLALDARQALSIDAPPACARIERIEVRLPPYAFRLVGRAWRIGTNPRVDAQFSARYCAASALVRGASRLTHFRSESIDDADIAALIGRIDVQPDPAMDARGHSAVNLAVRMRDGRSFERGLDIAPGFPGNGLSAQEHRGRFDDCIAYARHAPAAAQVALLLERIATLESMPDARRLLEGLVVSAA